MQRNLLFLQILVRHLLLAVITVCQLRQGHECGQRGRKIKEEVKEKQGMLIGLAKKELRILNDKPKRTDSTEP